jgi:hypothetical protein
MKSINFKFSGFSILFMLFGVILSFSCKKESYVSTAEITIVNSKNIAVSGAQVILSLDGAALTGNTKPITDSLKISDGSGLVKYEFNFPVIYTATVTKTITGSTSTDTLKGIARIKFEEGKTTRETIIIQ